MRKFFILLASLLLTIAAGAQQQPQAAPRDESADRAFEETIKDIDDVRWFMYLGDVAKIDKSLIASSKPIRMKNPTGQGAGNPLIIPVYTFTPKKLTGKAPLIVFVHGGVHGDFETSYAHIMRELMDQGYVVVAPEYRGSTGYGDELYEQIDYGGTEVDDVKAARDWAVENLPQVDGSRVGIIGWSHGGYQTLLNIFRWPDAYQVAYAGVPVSDLVQRMGYKSQGYRNIFAEFIGKQAADDPMEYRRRSPYFYADKLATPLLVHTNTSDEDVNVMEVQHLIDSLKASGKKFEYKIYENAPGGHHFNRIDTRLARDSRQEVYAFLARYLKEH
ncbi:MAG TPA: alpha/beta fold hydrolase [Thermoanaerobaculia bacterium]|jgi:dipeptidyl aminopeptidase/acylaminoacyl peptidase